MMHTYYVISCGLRECETLTDAYPRRADARAAVTAAGWSYHYDAGFRCPEHPVPRTRNLG